MIFCYFDLVILSAKNIVMLSPRHITHPIFVTFQGNHPLHVAAHKGHVECCKILIRAGAPLDATNYAVGRASLRFGKKSTIFEDLSRNSVYF